MVHSGLFLYHDLHSSCIALMLHHSSLPTNIQMRKKHKLSSAAFVVSLSKLIHYLIFSLCRQMWQLIAVKSGTKKVAITDSPGGPSEITIIPNRHFRQQPWLSQGDQWTHLNKIKSALHFQEIALRIIMGITYFNTSIVFLAGYLCCLTWPD